MSKDIDQQEDLQAEQQEREIDQQDAAEARDASGEGGDASQDKQEEEAGELESLQKELTAEKEKFLRLFAEFENFRKRTARERTDMFRTAGQDVIVSLLPVLDDFDRAMKELNKSGDEAALQGVALIHNKFKETLKSKGLEEISVAEGDTFDADVHEAVTQIPAPDKSLKGKVVDVIEKGFTLGDRVIRHPKVVVGN
ncbi:MULTISPECIES: nucleotide exchange factor GrpE [Robiginitalea]|uniref:Protein GrpE n=1 Tax=Robiginitalea biformata (strain ATCC BAA-864 / DSM 15991 / KCTC 12146 / HTCC2501) TaxID=313596 RepID=A4CMJ4_ROBBH|nr:MULTISPECIES: nucleotide exchange factor GrpE [Robiginitalea]EAR14886.1 GrpE protein (Hsp-70 cofactor) [Robiginitalea biformata HTCC2501]MDC6355292.1 nucleotide exchange factor GrpE [Robiginitalea sp. PM2]MDC6375493.1 nucleotide exchange factor GrpE [Robiginitalea sp. SP8]